MTRALAVCAAVWLCWGCGRENLDLLETTTRSDPCALLTTEAECRDNARLGCFFQPNPEGCLSTDPSCSPGACRSGDPFVRRVDKSFLLSGAPFRFVGVSSWALLLPEPCIQVPDQAAWLAAAFDDLVVSRSTVARMFAFQSSAGPTGEDFSLFDAAVREARRAGVRLIFMLEHSKGDCSHAAQSANGTRDAAWYAGGFRQVETGYTLSYQAFVEKLASRYSKEPTVLGYVLMEGTGEADTEAVVGFVNAVGGLLRDVAGSQLVSLDLSWPINSGNGGAAYRGLQSLPVVDYVDVDDYQPKDSQVPIDEALLGILAELDKPAVIGEGAVELKSDTSEAFVERAERVRGRLREWHDLGFAGGLLWAYQPGWVVVSEEFDARPQDPLLRPGGVLASAPW